MVKKIVKDFLYERESYLIRGAVFEVWKTFKGIFKEKIVENALKKELQNHEFKIESQKRISIYYKGEKVGTYTPDQIVNEAILIEIKVKPYLTKEDERQFWYYLRGSQYLLGFLINFGSKKLEIKRRIYDKAREKYKDIEADQTLIENAKKNAEDISVNQRPYQRISASTNKGFTLVEILVSIFIIMLMAGIIFANYRQGGKQFALQRSANKLAQDIRRAQQMAMSAQECKVCPLSKVPPRYGIRILKYQYEEATYQLFADLNNDGRYNGEPTDKLIEEIELEKGVTFAGWFSYCYPPAIDPTDAMNLTFSPPNPITTVALSGPGGFQICRYIDIYLSIENHQTKVIRVTESGMIAIQ